MLFYLLKFPPAGLLSVNMESIDLDEEQVHLNEAPKFSTCQSHTLTSFKSSPPVVNEWHGNEYNPSQCLSCMFCASKWWIMLNSWTVLDSLPLVCICVLLIVLGERNPSNPYHRFHSSNGQMLEKEATRPRRHSVHSWNVTQVWAIQQSGLLTMETYQCQGDT